jgi:hypothetical protein
MSNYYVKSGAAGAADGSSWANAYTTLAAALAARAAGDTFWVSHQHAETQASSMTITSPGTAAAPCRILCVNDGASPPTALATTATVSATGTSSTMIYDGFAYVYGIIFNIGGGSSSSSPGHFWSTSNPWWWKLEACSLRVLTTGGGSIAPGQASTGVDDMLLELVNTTVQFTSTAAQFKHRSRVRWTNTASAVLGTIPTSLFAPSSGNCHLFEIIGVDLSALGSGKSLITASTPSSGTYYLQDCKLGASVAITTGAVAGQGGVEVEMVNCDSGNTNYIYYKQTYQGTITQETTIVHTGGASDGTIPFSRKIVTTANTQLFSSLMTCWQAIWNESTSAITLNISAINSGGPAAITDADQWVEVLYPGTSGYPLGVFIQDRAANIMATPANQDTDTSNAWDSLVTARANSTAYALTDVRKVASNPGRIFFCTTAGTSSGSEPGGYSTAADGDAITDGSAVFTAARRYKLGVTFTPTGKGFIYWRVKTAKQSFTSYVGMKAELT